jgi:hypothetical protein
MHFVVTLLEKDFLHGAVVLYNSLKRNEFNGFFVIGYRERDALPASACIAFDQHSENVVWTELDTPLHFTNFKPQFMQQVLESYPECTTITYLDPDVVMNCPFHWIASWADGGPAVCGDVNWRMPSNHPTRRLWLARTGLKLHHQLDLYFNGGFVSVKRNDLAFLNLWKDIMIRWGAADTRLDTQGDISQWRNEGGRWLPFMAVDQDALNIAAMCWEGSITTLGPEVMGFAGFGELPHAVGNGKPWKRSYLLHALQGKPPRYVDKVFWRYADRPLGLYSAPRRLWIRFSLVLASLIGRFYASR